MVRAPSPQKCFKGPTTFGHIVNTTKMAYWSSIQFHHKVEQCDIMVIKSRDICNCTSEYNLTLNNNLNMSKHPKQDIFNDQDWVVAMSHAQPLTTPFMALRLIIVIKAHVGKYMAFHLGFPIE
jgi:hypothetical protein